MTTLEAPVDALASAHPAAVLEIKDLHVSYPARGGRGRKRRIVAIDGIDLEVREGETLGLVGESGCGKSTVVKTVLGLMDPTSGTIALHGEKINGLSGRRLRRIRPKVQVVFQDPYTALDPRMTVHDIVAEPLRINGCYTPERVSELLAYVGITDEMALRKPGSFSGGQRQRIGIARALALEPDVIVLDEPVSALDVSIQAQVVNLLQRLQDELGVSYLFIAHDLSVVRHMSQNIAVMYLGRIVEQGTREEIFTNPRHPYTRLLLEAIPVADPVGREERLARPMIEGDLPDPADLPTGCRFRTRCPRAEAICAESDPGAYEDVASPTHRSACFVPHTEPFAV